MTHSEVNVLRSGQLMFCYYSLFNETQASPGHMLEFKFDSIRFQSPAVSGLNEFRRVQVVDFYLSLNLI